MSDRLGGAVGRQPLHFFLVLDVSGSMLRDGRIQALNNAVRAVVPHLRDEAASNPHAEILVRVLAFATTSRWVVEEPTPIEQFRWLGVDAEPKGLTEMGSAFRDLAGAMRGLADEGRGYPPAIVLVSDGRPTHAVGPTFAEGLRELVAEPWGAAAVRLGLAVGTDTDMHALQRFVGREDIPLPRADSPEQLAELIVWAAKAASRSASSPRLSTQLGSTLSTPLPELPERDPIWAPTSS